MNWKTEAMNKLRHYDAMRQAVQNIPEEIERLEKDACSIRSARTDGTPVKGGGSGREEALLNNLVRRQELAETLDRTKLWLKTADRAMTVLSPEDRLILHRMYIAPEHGAVDRLCTELGVEQSSVYRRRDKALHLFTIALYGTESGT